MEKIVAQLQGELFVLDKLRISGKIVRELLTMALTK